MGVLRLAERTGWSLGEMQRMTHRGLMRWLDALPDVAPRPVYLVELRR